MKTMAISAMIIAAAAGMGGSAAEPAFGASEIGEANREALLPVSVMQMARLEGETPTDPADYTIVSDSPIDEEPPAVSGATLSELVEQRRSPNPRDREAECLSIGVYFESKSESFDGQLAVAQVMLNRARSGRFPSSVCGVLLQPSQFSFVRNGRYPAAPRSSKDWQEAVAIAHIAQDGLHQSPVPRALFFHARHVSPRWKLTRLATVGNHIFYR